MFLAMFQRTADTLRAAPTPTIAPVIVCVVETGMPRPVARKSVIAPPRFSAKALHRGQFGNFRAHSVDDPPAADKGAEPHRHLTAQHDPKGDLKFAAELAVRAVTFARQFAGSRGTFASSRYCSGP
jgi:hypothetical protein